MAKMIEAAHGLFYMENAGGFKPAQPEIPPSMVAEGDQEYAIQALSSA
jgi:hypothetical protein